MDRFLRKLKVREAVGKEVLLPRRQRKYSVGDMVVSLIWLGSGSGTSFRYGPVASGQGLSAGGGVCRLSPPEQSQPFPEQVHNSSSQEDRRGQPVPMTESERRPEGLGQGNPGKSYHPSP